MQNTASPTKFPIPFASSAESEYINSIPTASQVSTNPGLASLTDGFPPANFLTTSAGGVFPYGQDFNGILKRITQHDLWVGAGGGFYYDSSFSTSIGGYPAGARLLRTDNLGYWINTTENNTTDPEVSGGAAAGWVPDTTNGVTTVAMTNSDITLTPLQYGKPVIKITGILTGNVNLIFPAIQGSWTVFNNTSGSFTITCKTASGTGVSAISSMAIIGDGTNIYNINVPHANSADSVTNGVYTTGDQTIGGTKTFSINPIFSGGTANGVPYLNASKVLTTGSGLQFDGTNLGLGVTPSAWASYQKAIDFGGDGNYGALSARATLVELGNNCYYNDVGTSSDKYKISSQEASKYSLQGAVHKWYTAPSGTAGNAITFTEAMTLNATELLPGANNTQNFGSTSLKWANAYATTFNGDLSGNATTATNCTNAIGYSQTYQNLTSSRALSTTYTNSTEKPIFVNVVVNDLSGNSITFYVGGVVADYFTDAGGSAQNVRVSGIVPPGLTYSASLSSGSSTIVNWSELR